MDRNKLHSSLMAVLKGVASGKRLDDHVTTNDYGRKVEIKSTLLASALLTEDFHADDLPMVERAFRAIGKCRNSERKDAVALAIVRHIA